MKQFQQFKFSILNLTHLTVQSDINYKDNYTKIKQVIGFFELFLNAGY
jgi:hypothetical protein